MSTDIWFQVLIGGVHVNALRAGYSMRRRSCLVTANADSHLDGGCTYNSLEISGTSLEISGPFTVEMERFGFYCVVICVLYGAAMSFVAANT